MSLLNLREVGKSQTAASYDNNWAGFTCINACRKGFKCAQQSLLLLRFMRYTIANSIHYPFPAYNTGPHRQNQSNPPTATTLDYV